MGALALSLKTDSPTVRQRLQRWIFEPMVDQWGAWLQAFKDWQSKGAAWCMVHFLAFCAHHCSWQIYKCMETSFRHCWLPWTLAVSCTLAHWLPCTLTHHLLPSTCFNWFSTRSRLSLVFGLCGRCSPSQTILVSYIWEVYFSWHRACPMTSDAAHPWPPYSLYDRRWSFLVEGDLCFSCHERRCTFLVEGDLYFSWRLFWDPPPCHWHCTAERVTVAFCKISR